MNLARTLGLVRVTSHSCCYIDSSSIWSILRHPAFIWAKKQGKGSIRWKRRFIVRVRVCVCDTHREWLTDWHWLIGKMDGQIKGRGSGSVRWGGKQKIFQTKVGFQSKSEKPLGRLHIPQYSPYLMHCNLIHHIQPAAISQKCNFKVTHRLCLNSGAISFEGRTSGLQSISGLRNKPLTPFTLRDHTPLLSPSNRDSCVSNWWAEEIGAREALKWDGLDTPLWRNHSKNAAFEGYGPSIETQPQTLWSYCWLEMSHEFLIQQSWNWNDLIYNHWLKSLSPHSLRHKTWDTELFWWSHSLSPTPSLPLPLSHSLSLSRLLYKLSGVCLTGTLNLYCLSWRSTYWRHHMFAVLCAMWGWSAASPHQVRRYKGRVGGRNGRGTVWASANAPNHQEV